MTNPEPPIDAKGVELKPCPHCGSSSIYTSWIDNDHPIAFIGCDDCPACVEVHAEPHYRLRADVEAEAIAAWNTRAPASTSSPAIDREAVARKLHERFCARARARVTHDPADTSCYSNTAWDDLPPSMQREYLEDADAILSLASPVSAGNGGGDQCDCARRYDPDQFDHQAGCATHRPASEDSDTLHTPTSETSEGVSGYAMGEDGGPPDEDWLTDVIDDSLDMDWTGRVAARAIIAAWDQRNA